MSEFDPRWAAGHQDTPGQGGRPGEPGGQDQSGSRPAEPYPGFFRHYQQQGYPRAGQEYSSGQGLGDPSRAWAGYTYPGGQPGATGPTTPLGQPGWPQQQPGDQWGAQYPQYPPYQQTRRRPLRSVGFALGAVALSVLIGLGIGRLAWPTDNPADTATSGDQNFGSVPNPNAGNGGNGNGTSSINANAIAAKVDPALVDINTVLGLQNAEAAGTGVVLTSGGEVLTNNHVVEGATSIKVTDIGNGQTYTASVIGYDRTQDIAVLQLQQASGLKTATLGNSSKVAAGDAVVGIGNAGGAGGAPSVAPGRVTALNQSITASDDSSGASEKLNGLIQTDANIQAGDSGGSLVNSSGQVIGVDTAASSGYQFSGGYGQGGQGGSSGHQGYAIPIDHAISIAHQIIGHQASTTVHIGESAFMGVGVVDAGSQQQGQGQLGQGGQGGTGSGATSGAAITGVVPNGAAEQAGLQPGDVITAVNGKTVDSATTLTNLMDTFHPGDKLTITYTDASGAQHTAQLSAASGPVG